MNATLSLASAASLLAAMVVLAAVPSSSVLLVVSRASSLGTRHGILAALGVVVGDILFVLLAVYGLAAVVERWSWAFALFQLLSGVYLMRLGYLLWCSRSAEPTLRSQDARSSLSSFWAGLMLTLSDQKAVFFYLAFFPAFMDMRTLTHFDVAIIAMVTLLGVGGVKVAYAFFASSLSGRSSGRTRAKIAGLASVLLTAVGVYLVISGSMGLV